MRWFGTLAWNQFLNIVEMGLEHVEQGETVDSCTDIFGEDLTWIVAI